jgi:hypothetical protein
VCDGAVLANPVNPVGSPARQETPIRSAGRAHGQYELRRGQDVPSFPRTHFSANGILPPLRSGQVFLDEAEHYCTIAMPASLRSDGAL